MNFKVITECDGKTIHLLGSFKDLNNCMKANTVIYVYNSQTKSVHLIS